MMTEISEKLEIFGEDLGSCFGGGGLKHHVIEVFYLPTDAQ